MLIFDEAENIRPQTAGRIKALYDQLRRHDEGALCGFALIGTPDLVEYWDRATHNQIPGAAQFSRRLLKQNAAFQVPDVLDYESFFEAHGLTDQKLRLALRQEEEYGAVVSIHRALVTLCGQTKSARLLRTLQAAVHQQRPLLMSYLTEKQIRKIWVLLRQVKQRKCLGVEGAHGAAHHGRQDEKSASYAAAGGGSFD